MLIGNIPDLLQDAASDDVADLLRRNLGVDVLQAQRVSEPFDCPNGDNTGRTPR